MSETTNTEINCRGISVFSDLKDSEIAEIVEKLTTRGLLKNAALFANGELSNAVYFIVEGTLRATTYSQSGKEVSYQDLGPGEMFGELSALDGLPRTTGIVAITKAVVACMSAEDFQSVMERYPSVMRKVVDRLTELIRSLIGRVYEYSAMDVSDRIRAEIIRHAKKNITAANNAIVKKMPTHEEIANKVATHREAVTKEFSYLVKHGYIEKEGKAVIVTDFDKLCGLVEEAI